MAVRLDPRQYSAGAVDLDSSQPLDLYTKLLARKEAKDEAVNQYFNKLGEKLNTAGVRQQDLDGEHGGINKDIEAWKNNWVSKSDEIKKGGMAHQEHMAGLNKILTKIEQSKGRAKTELEIGKAKFEGKYDPDDDDINILGTIGKSIYDKSSYKQDGVSEYGFGDLSPAIPAFDSQKQTQFWAAATKGLTAGKTYDYSKKYTNPTTGQVIVPFKKAYNKEQIERIADEAGELIKGDKSARKYYNNILNNPDKAAVDELQAAYSKYYKGMVDTPEKAAVADAIIRATVPQEIGEEQEVNYAQRQQDKRINISLNTGGGGGVGNYTSSSGNQFDAIDLSKYGSPQNGSIQIRTEDIPESVKAILKTGGYDITDDDFFEIELSGGKIQTVRPIGTGKQRRGIISRNDMENSQLKYNTEPQKSNQPKFGDNNPKPPPKPTGKTETVAEKMRRLAGQK